MGFFEFFEKNGVWKDPNLTQAKMDEWERKYWELYPLKDGETPLEAIMTRQEWYDIDKVLAQLEKRYKAS